MSLPNYPSYGVPLQTFESPWTHLYESLLECLDSHQKTIVRVVTHHDGQLLLKYQVAIVTPSDLGFRNNLYTGEAYKDWTAFEIAIIKAIKAIRKGNDRELRSTTFYAIPYENGRTPTTQENLDYVRNSKPEEIVAYLDDIAGLLKAFLNTHQTLVEEVTEAMYELTDPIGVMNRRKKFESEEKPSTHALYDMYMDTEEEEEETKVVILEQDLNRPYNPYFPSSYSNIIAQGWEPKMKNHPPEPKINPVL